MHARWNTCLSLQGNRRTSPPSASGSVQMAQTFSSSSARDHASWLAKQAEDAAERRREERTIIVEIVHVWQVVLCRIRLQIGLIDKMHPTEHTPAKLAHQYVAFPHHIHHLHETSDNIRMRNPVTPQVRDARCGTYTVAMYKFTRLPRLARCIALLLTSL